MGSQLGESKTLGGGDTAGKLVGKAVVSGFGGKLVSHECRGCYQDITKARNGIG